MLKMRQSTPSPYAPVIMPPQGVNPDPAVNVIYGTLAQDDSALPAPIETSPNLRKQLIVLGLASALSGLGTGLAFGAFKRTNSALVAAAAFSGVTFFLGASGAILRSASR